MQLQQSNYLRSLIANNPNLAALCSSDLLQQAAAAAAAAAAASPLGALPTIDTSSSSGLLHSAAASSSGLPSTSRSEAQDTESDRAVSPHSPTSADTLKPFDLSTLLTGSSVVQFAAKTPSSLSPQTSGLSVDDCSESPSSSASSAPSPECDDKFVSVQQAAAAAAAAAGLQHSIAALISPEKGGKESSTSPSSAMQPSSPEPARLTPSPSIESRKRRRTINDVISALHSKQSREGDDE